MKLLILLLLLLLIAVSLVDAFSVVASKQPLLPTAAYRRQTSKTTTSTTTTTALRSAAYHRHQQGNIEIGIQTAQLLMNKKKHSQVKADIQKRYPFVPAVAIESLLNIVAGAFKTVAPETLKQALKPGGMDQVRPVLSDAVVSAVLSQPAVKNSPILSKTEKDNLVATLVDLALDQLLRDAEYLLQRPEVRLEELHEQMKLIEQTEMTRWQLTCYRFRRHPVRWTVGITAGAFYVYAQTLHGGSYLAAARAVQHGLGVAARKGMAASQLFYAASLRWARVVSKQVQALMAFFVAKR